MTQSTLDTLSGIIQALLALAAIFGLKLPPETAVTVISVIVAVWGAWKLFKGWFSNNKTTDAPAKTIAANNAPAKV